MSKKFDFERMPIDEMWQLHEEISRVLSIRLTAEKRELQQRLARLGRKRDLPPPRSAGKQALIAAPRERRRYPRVLPKYQNPDEPSATWSGRGKQPRWLSVALQAGRSIEEFAITNPPNHQNSGSATGVARSPTLNSE